MKTRKKKKPQTPRPVRTSKKVSKKPPRKNKPAKPAKIYSDIQSIWDDAPKDETRDGWIYDRLGVPLSDRTSPEDVHRSFQVFLMKLDHLIHVGRLSEASLISKASVHLLLRILDGMEERIPQFRRYKVVESLLKEMSNEWTKRKAVPTRKEAEQRAFYSRSCENALKEVIIPHRAGWRKYWHGRKDLPDHPFGSSTDWERWSLNFLKTIHEAGLLRANPASKAARGERAGARLNVHKRVFNKFIKLSQAQLEIVLDTRLLFLNTEVELKSKGQFKTFYQQSALNHPECAPQSILKDLANAITKTKADCEDVTCA
jgi:hypothetical protein